MLHLVYTEFGVRFTRCNAVLGVNAWSCHGGIERNNLYLCSAMRVELWAWMRDGGWRWELYGGYKSIWDIRSTTCLIGFRRPRIGVVTCRIGTRTCHIGDGKLTCTRHSLKSQFSMLMSPISSDLSLCRSQLYQYQRTRCYVISLDLSIPWSLVNTEYSIIPRSTISSSQPVSHLSADVVVVNSVHSHNYKLTNE